MAGVAHALCPASPAAASTAGDGVYRPREPEDSLLYRVLAGNLETFLARQQRDGRYVPYFVERELRSYLECGILAYGFLRLQCESCQKEKLVPFSCKSRSTCPSCCGRRMADTAAHLVDHVFPHVPVRQWVLSLPFGLRYRLAYDPQMVTAVLGVFARAVFGLLRRLARDCGIDQTQCGAVTFIQRFGGSLNANLHLHMVAIDGVYAPDIDGVTPRFYELSAPSQKDIDDLTRMLAIRIPAVVAQRDPGVDSSDPDSDPLSVNDPWLASLYAASVSNRILDGPNAGKRIPFRGDRVDPEAIDVHSAPLCATVDGFNLHAAVAVPGRDRSRLERLLRYTARPPFAMDRLEELTDGRISYRFKTPWRNGATHAVFTPLELIEKLAALVPTPRAHLVRFHGVLAPAANWRPLIVPRAEEPAAAPAGPESIAAPTAAIEPPDAYPATAPEASEVKATRRRVNYTWAQLMKRVFLVDILLCDCGGKLRLLSAIHPPETTRKILECLGLPSRPPPLAPAALDAASFIFD